MPRQPPRPLRPQARLPAASNRPQSRIGAGSATAFPALSIRLDNARTKNPAGARLCGAFRTILASGAPGTIRTSDPQIRSLMLYPAELRAHNALCGCHSLKRENGAPGTIRTSDPQIRSLMLYPAELRAQCHSPTKDQTPRKENGAPGTIRTSDPQIRSLMLYPAELRARWRGANRSGWHCRQRLYRLFAQECG